MFWGLLSTIFYSFGTIFWKMALNFRLSFNLSPRVFWMLASFWQIIIILLLLSTNKYSFSWINYNILLLAPLITILNFTRVQISQYVSTREKLSTLTPYENINKIISIILAFFIFSDVSLFSFLLTLSAWIIISLSSIDFKTLKVPKLIKLFSLAQIIQSSVIILVWYILKQITNVDYYIISASLYAIFIFSIVFYKKELWQLKDLPKWFYLRRFSASTCGSLSEIINFYIISSLWVTISILFSYIYIWLILILSYIFFKDKPTKKNIALTIILAILVWLGYYYK